MLLGSMLLCASLIWNGPLRRGLEGKRWWEGSKGSLRGILMSHPGPSLSHLHQCGGCKAPEQVGKTLALKILVLSQELWPAVSFSPSSLCLWTKSYWAHTFVLLSCDVCQVVNLKPSNVCTLRENIFFTTEPSLLHASRRALTCWTLERKIMMISRPRRFSQTLCACAHFKTGRGNVVKSEVCYPNSTPQEPLIYPPFHKLNGPHDSFVLRTLLSGGIRHQPKI